MMAIKDKICDKSEVINHKSKPFETSKITEVSRELEVDDKINTKYKFKEELVFSNKQIKDEKFVVCIGFNPADASDELDVTNKRLINALQDEYSGYVLLNIYSEITSKAVEVNLDDLDNSLNLSRVINYIESLSEEINIIIFFGASYAIREDLYEYLKKLAANYRLFKTANSKHAFRHPASIGSVNLARVNLNDFIPNYFIK